MLPSPSPYTYPSPAAACWSNSRSSHLDGSNKEKRPCTSSCDTLLAANPCLTVPAQGRIPHTTLECIRTIREKLPNAQVSVEVEKPGRDGLRELAAEANVVFYSKSWAEVCDTAPQGSRTEIQENTTSRSREQCMRRKKETDCVLCIELWSWVC